MFIEGILDLRGFQISIDDMKTTLTDHLVSFKHYYSKVSENILDVVSELLEYRIFENPLENYDSETTDLFLSPLGHTFDVNVIVYQSIHERCWILNLSDVRQPISRHVIFCSYSLTSC